MSASLVLQRDPAACGTSPERLHELSLETNTPIEAEMFDKAVGSRTRLLAGVPFRRISASEPPQ